MLTSIAKKPYIFEIIKGEGALTPCSPSGSAHEPRHQLNLIIIFAVHMKKALVLSYPFQTDLSLCYGHTDIAGLVKS